MSRGALEIDGCRVPRGCRRQLQLKVSELYDASPLCLPLCVVRGRRSGPTLFVTAALHGDELVGVEIIRRLVERVDEATLRGTVLLVPIANMFGILHRSRYLPDRRDLNRSFPGDPDGSAASRVAHVIHREIVQRADVGIDLHSAAAYRTHAPHIRAELADRKLRELAEAFGSEYLVDAQPPRHSIRDAASRVGVPVMVYEAGEVLRIEEDCVRIGLRGCLQVMRHLDMITPESTSLAAVPPADATRPRILSKSLWVRSPCGGILESRVQLGQQVRRGETLLVSTNPLGSEQTSIGAPRDGVIIGLTTLPLVNPGDPLVHLAWHE